ncbi:agouti signaling protein 1 isoform X2 [Hypanus sabinus]|uniref:agouti signaling protein 1 isoform X2 n=1 Tax=Hypanus sabinus TaxID=79690 RepID=UPI0028C51140|nr:agouti signaling protein 1 isoform X2 [Hypanus sabinus]
MRNPAELTRKPGLYICRTQEATSTEQRNGLNGSSTLKMAGIVYYYWILQCTCCILVYSHLVIEEKFPETPQNKNISDLHQSKYTGISIVELPSSRKFHFRRESGRIFPNQLERDNRIPVGPKIKKLRRYDGHCVQLWGVCLPPSPPCCNPCAFCHCRFFNTICYCRKLNSKCMDRT